MEPNKAVIPFPRRLDDGKHTVLLYGSAERWVLLGFRPECHDLRPAGVSHQIAKPDLLLHELTSVILSHGIMGTATYVNGDYLATSSPGYHSGTPINNFLDTFQRQSPFPIPT
jgi:hypothetical protein